jgi:cyanoexosortase B
MAFSIRAENLPRRPVTWAVLGLMALLYGPLLWHWVMGWLHKSISTEHEYFSHGMIGLPFAAYLCWQRRSIWARLAEDAHPLGALVLGIAGVFYLSQTQDFINLSLPLMLVGICLWLKGLPGLRSQAFPLLLVGLATPTEVPYLIAPYTLPLQKFIAGFAGVLLGQAGMQVHVEDIYLYVNDRIVEVAPYCAGLKMLFTTFYVCLMLLYWTGLWRSRSHSMGLLCGGMVISVAANIIRNTCLSYFHGTGNDRAFEWLHDSWGGDLYSTLMLMTIVLLLRVMEHYWPIPENTPGTKLADP